MVSSLKNRYQIYRNGSQIDSVGLNSTSYSDGSANGATNYTYAVYAYWVSIRSLTSKYCRSYDATLWRRNAFFV